MMVLMWLYIIKKRNLALKGPYKKDVKHWNEHQEVFKQTLREYMSVLNYSLYDFYFGKSDFNDNMTVFCDKQNAYNDLKHLMRTRAAGVKMKFCEKIKSDHNDLIKTETTKLGDNAVQVDYMSVNTHKIIFSANLVLLDNKEK